MESLHQAIDEASFSVSELVLLPKIVSISSSLIFLVSGMKKILKRKARNASD